jgi:hypothetical protein
MPASKKTKIILWVGAAVVLSVALLFRLYREVVPRGIESQSLVAWIGFTFHRADFVSPDGARRVAVYSNDGGAMHSGLHYSFVIERQWLWGRRVVAEGYLEPPPEPVTLEWLGESEFRVDFCAGRYESKKIRSVHVDLDGGP